MIVPLINETMQKHESFKSQIRKNNIDVHFHIKTKNLESLKVPNIFMSSMHHYESNGAILADSRGDADAIVKKSHIYHNFNNCSDNKNLSAKKSSYLSLVMNQEEKCTNFENKIVLSMNHYKKFSKEEDELLKKTVKIFGAKNWRLIASFIPGRNQKQCRDRYSNYLAPGICHTVWSDEEDKLLVEKYIKHGRKWSFLKTFFPNRTSNDIKNRFNYTIYHQISILKELSNSKH